MVSFLYFFAAESCKDQERRRGKTPQPAVKSVVPVKKKFYMKQNIRKIHSIFCHKFTQPFIKGF